MRGLPPVLAAPIVLSAWAACACVGTAEAQPPPFTRVDAAAFTAHADAATAMDARLAERRREDARVAGLAALGIKTGRVTTDASGRSSDGATPGWGGHGGAAQGDRRGGGEARERPVDRRRRS